jgi:DeoR/GlpR family transcriptional regulator of sugar metabolism
MIELSSAFPAVTQRTLRRDMDKLESLGVVKQVGKTRDSYYELLKI